MDWRMWAGPVLAVGPGHVMGGIDRSGRFRRVFVELHTDRSLERGKRLAQLGLDRAI